MFDISDQVTLSRNARTKYLEVSGFHLDTFAMTLEKIKLWSIATVAGGLTQYFLSLVATTRGTRATGRLERWRWYLLNILIKWQCDNHVRWGGGGSTECSRCSSFHSVIYNAFRILVAISLSFSPRSLSPASRKIFSKLSPRWSRRCEVDTQRGKPGERGKRKR